MLEVHIPSVGPEAEEPRQSPEKGHMVFQVEVLYSGRRHTVPRRYSEFHALHKRIKKRYKVPDFPSKRLPNWRTRGLEQRRQGLETYIQFHFPEQCSQLHHRPVIGFCMDPYVYTPSPEPLPEVVVDGVLQGLYGFSTSPAKG
ncbi:Sorting nexin-22 [Cricetulus griseus]|uniref:Sorting nexin-22 n=1 Tax=Cricetulus griseus TaxID=10029 RepID=G3H532_CRIGR|nr:Sorting nexin-22 [Cricetulus griseus]ERE75731.1 sorting nexin-22-like protein [Cricetulus griseus]